MSRPKLPLPSCPLKVELYLVPPSLNPKLLGKFPSSSRQVISWCLILLKVYQLLYTPLKDTAFKEQACATHTGEPPVKTHSKKFCLEGLVWSCCLGCCFGGSQFSPCPPKGTVVPNKAFWLTLQGPGTLRWPSSWSSNDICNAPPKNPVPLLCSGLSICELSSTVGMLILSKDDMKLTHSSYLIRHRSARQLLVWHDILHISKWMTKET